MAHDGRGTVMVRRAMRECIEVYIGDFLDDINAQFGWKLPEPAEYRNRQLVPDRTTKLPLVGIWTSGNSRMKGCTGSEWEFQTTFRLDLLFGYREIGAGMDPDDISDAHEEYNLALLRCLNKDITENGGRLAAAGVLFVPPVDGAIQMHFSPFDESADGNGRPHIRLGESAIVIQHRLTV